MERNIVERWGWLLLLPGILWLSAQGLRLSANKFFAIDEFQYAHAAWLVANDAIPYRDFFDHHFPFLYQALSLVVRVLGDDPSVLVVQLRRCMLLVLVVIALGAWMVNRRETHWAGLFAVLSLLSCWPFLARAVEIRPDPLALGLFLASLSVLYAKRVGNAGRGLMAGLLLAGAVWTSQKLFVYGLGMMVAFLRDLYHIVRRRPVRFTTGHPLSFGLGSLLVLAPIALYLVATRSLGPWFEWSILWSFSHEREISGFTWTEALRPVLFGYPWLVLLGGTGLFLTARDRLRTRDVSDPDLLLLLALPLTFLSYTIQKAPYTYSLIPFLGILCIFAGRGIGALLQHLSKRASPAWSTAVTAVFVLGIAWSGSSVGRLAEDGNRYQLEILRELDAMTSPTDVVYDNAGGFISRPHVHYYYFTSRYIREKEGERLAREVPQAIRETGCTVYLHDFRTLTLARSLQLFILSHFQRVHGDLWLWGRVFVPEAGRSTGQFEVVKAGSYYVFPPDLPSRGRLRVGGREIAGAIFHLEEGVHEVTWEGPDEPFSILWLPRNEKLYPPLPGKRLSDFSRV